MVSSRIKDEKLFKRYVKQFKKKYFQFTKEVSLQFLKMDALRVTLHNMLNKHKQYQFVS